MKKEIEKGYTLSYPDISELSELRKCHFQLYLNLPGVNYGLALQMVNNLEDPAELIVGDTGKSLSEALLFAEHGENMLCTEIVLNVKNNFCTQHVLPMF